MKKCDWALWLNGKKIFSLRELRENFDTALLTGYFLGGSLMKWLADLGEAAIVRRLADVDMDGDIGKQLEFAFGVVPDVRPPESETPKPVYPFTSAEEGAAAGVLTVPAEQIAPDISSVFSYSGSFRNPVSSYKGIFAGGTASSFSSVTESSFAAAALNAVTGLQSSFTAASSYNAFVSGQALYITGSSFTGSSGGSFLSLFFGRLLSGQGSFVTGSGSSFVYSWLAWLYKLYGSAGSGSFKGGFTTGSGAAVYGFGGLTGSGGLSGSFLLSLLRGGSWSAGGLAGSGGFGSRAAFLSSFLMNIQGSGGSFVLPEFSGEIWESGSFSVDIGGVTITADEFRRTLINLTSCPLNAYGYGINLI